MGGVISKEKRQKVENFYFRTQILQFVVQFLQFVEKPHINYC